MARLPELKLLGAGDLFTTARCPHAYADGPSWIVGAPFGRNVVDLSLLLQHDILHGRSFDLNALPLILFALEKLRIVVDCSASRPTVHAHILKIGYHCTVAARGRYTQELLQQVFAAEGRLVRSRLMLLLL